MLIKFFLNNYLYIICFFLLFLKEWRPKLENIKGFFLGRRKERRESLEFIEVENYRIFT